MPQCKTPVSRPSRAPPLLLSASCSGAAPSSRSCQVGLKQPCCLPKLACSLTVPCRQSLPPPLVGAATNVWLADEGCAGGQLVLVKEPHIFDHPAAKACARTGKPPAWQKWTCNDGKLMDGVRGTQGCAGLTRAMLSSDGRAPSLH